MGITSLQVCMDSSDWFQGTMHNEDESGMDSSSPSDMDMLTCTAARPTNMMERRLRPPHDQAIKCPRCDSAHTKFCYYNNYSLSQPRYFCKTCRRYWTKGGSLRNIPVGGACRKNKKPSSSKKPSSGADHSPTDLHLSFPNPADIPYGLLGAHHPNFLETKYNAMLHDPIAASRPPIDFMLGQTSRNNNNYDFMGGFYNNNPCPPFAAGMDYPTNNNGGTSGGFGVDTCQRLMLPYEDQEQNNVGILDVKPKLLSLPWQDQQQNGGCTDAGKDTFGYVGSWGGMINGYGSSATNPLV